MRTITKCVLARIGKKDIERMLIIEFDIWGAEGAHVKILLNGFLLSFSFSKRVSEKEIERMKSNLPYQRRLRRPCKDFVSKTIQQSSLEYSCNQ
jgi:hypothetical protein